MMTQRVNRRHYLPWWCVVGVLLALLLMGGFAEGKKKKVKTTFKALKCSACKAIADEMRAEIQHEWETRAGETVLVEKRKKKVKIPYPETELAVTEAVDRVCTKESRFDNYNVSSVDGKAEYVKGDKRVGNKQYKTELMNMCQTLIAEHEHEIVQFFYSQRGTPQVEVAEANICSEIGNFCAADEFVKLKSDKEL